MHTPWTRSLGVEAPEVDVAEAGGGGLEKFLLDGDAPLIKAAHAALKEIDQRELLTRLEAGIPHAISWDAEFTVHDDAGWFRGFPINDAFPSFEAIDDARLYDVLVPALYPVVASYIEANAASL